MAHAGTRKREGKSARKESFFARLGFVAKTLIVGRDDDEPPSERAQEIKGLIFIAFSIWLFLALISYYQPYADPGAAGLNWGGKFGFYAANVTVKLIGLSGLLFCWLAGCWGAILVARKALPSPWVRTFGGVSFIFSIAMLLEMTFGDSVGATNRLPYGVGGWMAHALVPALQEKFGGPGLWVMMPVLALVSFMLATEMAFYPSIVALREWADKRREERGESFGRAAWNWVRGLALGLWDFLRGAPIGESAKSLAEARAADSKTIVPDEDDVAEARENVTVEELVPQPKPPAKVAPVDAVGDGDDEDEFAPPLPAVKPGVGAKDDLDEELDREAARAAAADDEEEDDETPVATRGSRSKGSAADDEDEFDDDDAPAVQDEDDDEVVPAPVPKKERAPKAIVKKASGEKPRPPSGPWKLPPLDLLEPPERDFSTDNRAVQDAARKLENALKSFRVDANVVSAQVGPTVILFELEVAQGTRLNKVTQLSQEIAAALRAQSVRVIAPIPGKATIGIEVPNNQRRKVRISELVSQKAYDTKQIALPLFLGVDVEGNPIVDDLAKMPHLLIAGTTGSGKSVCINTILASFLLTRSPHDVQAILIDPKMVELQAFATIPHLMLPVVTDMRQATNVLMWAVEKMEGRYELFSQVGVKNIKGYNALSEDELKQRMGDAWSDERTPRHVPYIVVVIDEFADLMMQSKKEAEQAITRLAQKSRAVGIHVILATQRPSTDVITGVIKGNLPTRIAFQVASKVDSRVILDSMGAEKLLGGGDMLYNPPQSSKIKRVQGALVEDHEIGKLVEFVCKESAPNFNQELLQVATGSAQPGGDSSGFESALEDELWDEAVRIILKSKRGSASLLQRALGIGYTRASRLLDMMGEAGIVSDHKGSKAREVLMTLEQWEAQHGAPTGQGASGAPGGHGGAHGADDE
ncbi:MAG: DNA translocase FtsK [Planctomycetes bacterium]|nr:DNA translocase FtsK [Planctomycetota bacterium]